MLLQTAATQRLPAEPRETPAIALPTVEPTNRQKIKAADEAVKAALNEETKLDVIETPFGDVIKDLAKTLEITVVLDPEGLDEAGVTIDQLVTLNLHDKRAASILRILLEPLHLHHAVRDGVVVITSEEKYREEFLHSRVFDIRELLEKAGTPSKPLPRLDPASAFGAFGPAGGGKASGSDKPATALTPPPYEPQSPADHLVSMVCEMVAPSTWVHRGGFGTMKVFGGTLIVRQTDEALAEIEGLLEELREKSK